MLNLCSLFSLSSKSCYMGVYNQDLHNYFVKKNLISDSEILNYVLNLSGESFRQVKNRSTLRVNINNKYYFIKKHLPLSLKEIIKNLTSFKWPFCSALNECRAIEHVKRLDIKTLEVSACGMGFSVDIQDGSKTSSKFRSSYIITDAIEPNIDLDKLCEKLSNKKKYFLVKRELIKFLAKSTRRLHLNGLNHRDYYLCHYILKISDNNDKSTNIEYLTKLLENSASNTIRSYIQQKIISSLYLIDLHRMQIREKTPIRYIIKDLSALLFSVRNLKLTNKDYLRFIKIYFNIENRSNFRKLLSNEQGLFKKIRAKASAMREK